MKEKWSVYSKFQNLKAPYHKLSSLLVHLEWFSPPPKKKYHNFKQECTWNCFIKEHYLSSDLPKGTWSAFQHKTVFIISIYRLLHKLQPHIAKMHWEEKKNHISTLWKIMPKAVYLKTGERSQRIDKPQTITSQTMVKEMKTKKENYRRSKLSLTFGEAFVNTNKIPFPHDKKLIFALLHLWFSL